MAPKPNAPLTNGPAVKAHPPEWVGDVKALLAYIDALGSLMAFYRGGSLPPERVHSAIDRYGPIVQAIRATHAEVTRG